MLHARSDYDAIQDPREGGIGEDEPVFLLRAKDPLFLDVVESYARRAQAIGCDPDMIEGIKRHVSRAVCWQAEHGTNPAGRPDVPAGAMR